MTNSSERLKLNDGRPAVATYSRLPVSRKRRRAKRPDEAAGPMLTAVGGPVLNATEVPFPDRGAYDAPPIGDFLGERRWPLSLKAALAVGLVALLGGAGVLTSAYNAAVSVRLDQPAAAAAAPLVDDAPVVVTAAPVETTATPVVTDPAVQPSQLALGVPDAPMFVPPVVTEIPPIQPPPNAGNEESSGGESAAAGDDPPPPMQTPPTPRRRPLSQTGAGDPQTPPEQARDGEMDRLMDEIDQILASLPPASEPVVLLPPMPLTSEVRAPPGVAPWPGTSGDQSGDGGQTSDSQPLSSAASSTPTQSGGSGGVVETLESVFSEALPGRDNERGSGSRLR